MFLACVYVTVAAAWVWQYDLARDTKVYSALALGAFLVRVLGVHMALAGIVVVAGALVLRHWRYAAASLPLLVFLLWPVRGGLEGEPTAQMRSGDVTVMTVNLRYDSQQHDDVQREIARADPDVVLFQEYSLGWVEALRGGLGPEYPHVIEHPRSDPQGIAIYSRLEPLADGREHRVQLGHWAIPIIRASFEKGGSRFVLYDVHLACPCRCLPTSSSVDSWPGSSRWRGMRKIQSSSPAT